MEKEVIMINKLIILLGQYVQFRDEVYRKEFNMLFNELCVDENLSPPEIYQVMFGNEEGSLI